MSLNTLISSTIPAKKAATRSSVASLSSSKTSIRSNVGGATSSDFLNFATAKASNQTNLRDLAISKKSRKSLALDRYNTLVAAASAALLLHFEGTNGSQVTSDSGANAASSSFVFAGVFGQPTISTTRSKFGSASLACNITGYVRVTNSSVSAIATGDFTLECFFYATSFGSGSGWSTYLSLGTSSAGVVLRISSSNQVQVIINGTTQNVATIANGLNTWRHIAIVRIGGTVKVYYDGSAIGNSFASSANIAAASLFIGNANPTVTDNDYCSGNIDEVRLLVGNGVYTGNFLVPTSAFTTQTQTPSLIPPSSLLLHFDGTNGSSSTSDSGQYAASSTITMTGARFGQTSISSGQAKFGSTSMSCNVTGYTSVVNTNIPALGTNDFTLEFFMYPTSFGPGSGWSTYIMLGTSSTGLTIRISNSRFLQVTINGNTYTSATAVIPNTLNAWHHLAFVRSSGVGRVYYDGTDVSGAISSNYSLAAATLYIGNANPAVTDNDYCAGYVDELRLLQNIAIYTGNFSSPGSAFAS
jgi:hypothetical protein